MLHIPYLREHKNEIIKKLKIKNFEANEIIEKLLNKDDSRKATQKELDDLLSKSNQLSKQIGELYKSGDTEKAKWASKKNRFLIFQGGMQENLSKKIRGTNPWQATKLNQTNQCSTPIPGG